MSGAAKVKTPTGWEYIATGPQGPPGSRGAGGLSLEYVPGPGTTTIDEFNDGALDPAWIHVDNPSGGAARLDWREAGEILSCANAGGDATNELHALMQPIGTAMATGDAWITRATMDPIAQDFGMIGIAIADGVTFGAGNQVVGTQYRVGSTYMALTAFTGYNSNSGLNQAGYVLYSPTWLRVVYLGSNNWRFDRSPNGVHWAPGMTLSQALVPTHVGLISTSWGTATQSIVSYDLFRRTAGVS